MGRSGQHCCSEGPANTVMIDAAAPHEYSRHTTGGMHCDAAQFKKNKGLCPDAWAAHKLVCDCRVVHACISMREEAVQLFRLTDRTSSG